MSKKLMQFHKFFWVLCFLLSVVNSLTAQTTISNKPAFNITDYKILPDAGYSFNRILTDTSLKFNPGNVLRTAVSNSYWIKASLYNPYPNNENYIISLSGPVNYTLYYADSAANKWLSRPFGLNTSNGRRSPFTVPYTLRSKAQNTFYLKADLGNIHTNGRAIHLGIVLEKEISFTARDEVQTISYLICCVAVISFLCYNLYIYFHLRDKVYLYYVYAQLGALFYITGTYRYANVLLPLRLYNQQAGDDGYVDFFNINSFFIHLGVSLIFWGFAQFTRSYLNTKQLLPRCDIAIKLLVNTYVTIEATHTLLTITGIYYFEPILLDNIFVLAVIAACVVSGFIAYQNRVRAAKHFLAAILLPIIFTALQSAYIILYATTSPVLPVIAILSQILTFAVALVARVKLINDDLHAKALEAIKLEASKTVTEQLRVIAKKESQFEKEKNELLQLRLEANHRELAGNSLYIHQKNMLLADLKTKVKDISSLYPNAEHDALRTIQSSLQDVSFMVEEWDKFKLHFEQVHPSFFVNLQASHPALTKYELRLYAYFHINMSTKEIAALLNIAPASVRQAKARLNKKMNL